MENVCSYPFNCTSYFGSAPMRVRRLQLFERGAAIHDTYRVKPSELDVWTDHHVAKAGQAFLEVWHEGTDRQDDAVDAAAPALLDGSPRLDGRTWQQVGTAGNHLDGCRIAAGIR